MASCKECFHYDVCKIIHYPSLFGLTDDGCDHFKNKEDVVPVVRCKDCKYSTERKGFENRMWNDDCVMCDHIAPSDRIPMNKTDFCSYGERKDK